MEDLVLRTVYLTREQNSALVELSRVLGCSVSELIRAAIASRLPVWQKNQDALIGDLAAAKSDTETDEEDDLRHRVAKVINGPTGDESVFDSQEHLRQLRQVRWDMLYRRERLALLALADAVLVELGISA